MKGGRLRDQKRTAVFEMVTAFFIVTHFAIALTPITSARIARNTYSTGYAIEFFFLVENQWNLQCVFLDLDGNYDLETCLSIGPDNSLESSTIEKESRVSYDPKSNLLPNFFRGISVTAKDQDFLTDSTQQKRRIVSDYLTRRRGK